MSTSVHYTPPRFLILLPLPGFEQERKTEKKCGREWRASFRGAQADASTGKVGAAFWCHLPLTTALIIWKECITKPCKLTMLFILDDEEPALCFRKLLSSSGCPSFGFMIIRLLPAVPSEDDLRRFSMNLPSRYGLKLLARFTVERHRNAHNQKSRNWNYSLNISACEIALHWVWSI